jgi:hypothetical protein
MQIITNGDTRILIELKKKQNLLVQRRSVSEGVNTVAETFPDNGRLLTVIKED